MRNFSEENDFNYEVVMKIIGSYIPTGESREDSDRLDNFNMLLQLTQNLIDEIDAFTWKYKDSKQGSVQRFVERGEKFMEQFKQG